MRWLLACFLLLVVAPAWAHRMAVSAHVEDDQLVVHAQYADGKPASHARVLLTNDAGRFLREDLTDQAGFCRTRLAGLPDVCRIAVTQAGHRGTCRFDRAQPPGPALPRSYNNWGRAAVGVLIIVALTAFVRLLLARKSA